MSTRGEALRELTRNLRYALRDAKAMQLTEEDAKECLLYALEEEQLPHDDEERE